MLVEFWRKQILPLWGKTNYFPRQKYLSSFHCTEDGSSRSLLNLDTGLHNKNAPQLRTHYGVLSPPREPENSYVLGRLQNCEILFFSSCLFFRPSVRPSVRPGVCMDQLSSHWTDFHEIWYLSIFRNSVDSSFVTTRQWERVLYMNTNIHFYHISISSS
jgi:hypothetical protein